MSVQFDPKAKAQGAPTQQIEEAFSMQAQGAPPQQDPATVMSEMDLLLSGLAHRENLQRENPQNAINVPDMDKNVPQVLQKSSGGMNAVIQRYRVLKRNLLERKENFEKALKHYLTPDEALDLIQRLEEVEKALLETEQNLQHAMNLQAQLKERERAQSEV